MTDGILNVNKPSGWTSSDVVGFVRGRSRVKRVGHAGTLDPAATGVLPILIGKATRLAEYLVDATKTYVATIELGVETDTYDADGEVLSRHDAANVTRADVEAALVAFRGAFEQVPPAYSAIKRDGVPLYKRARRGEAVELTPRPVRVDGLDIMAYEPPVLRVVIECSKGFYVRSLAHDIGAKLGVGGSLTALERTRVGTFRVEDAVDVETLRAEFETGVWLERLLAPDEVLLGWQAAILGETNQRRLLQGQRLELQVTAGAPQRCRAYNAEGEFLAVLEREGEALWRAGKVLASPDA